MQALRKSYQTSLIPFCRKNSRTNKERCSDFKPAMTNDGICLSRNGGPIDTIFKSSAYIDAFKETFIPGRDKDPVLMNKGSGKKFQFSFVIDGQRTMDLKRGVKWNERKTSRYYVAIHPNHNMADIQEMFGVTSAQISAGYKTTIKVKGIDFVSEPQISDIDVSKRNCKFENENGESGLFKWYSRYVITQCMYLWFL